MSRHTPHPRVVMVGAVPMMTAAAPCGALVAARNAFATASATLSGSSTSPVNLVTVFIIAAAVHRLMCSFEPVPPAHCTAQCHHGSCSVFAVSRPTAAAMNAAFCS
jgi:hypothetical protein